MDALLIGKSGQGRTPREWRSSGKSIIQKIGTRLKKKKQCIIQLRWIVRCADARWRKTNGQDMFRQRNIAAQLRGEAVMEIRIGVYGGVQRVGWTDNQGWLRTTISYKYIMSCYMMTYINNYICHKRMSQKLHARSTKAIKLTWIEHDFFQPAPAVPAGHHRPF